MHRNYVDLTGQKFGTLTVQSFHSSGKNKKWNCLCECGKQCIRTTIALRREDDFASCGCKKGNRVSLSKVIHGGYLINRRLIGILEKMIYRCSNPKDVAYHNYGGRGIRVCREWIDNPTLFMDWALANGYNDTLTIDRENVDGNYEPSNCRWITLKENNQNRRNTLGWVKVKEIKFKLRNGARARDLAVEYGVGTTCIWGIKKGRYYSNVSIDD